MGPHAYYHPIDDHRDMEQAAPGAPSSRPSTGPPTEELTRHFPAPGPFSLARLGLSKLVKKPIVRWAGLCVALGATVWVLYPYFFALGLFLDRRPGGHANKSGGGSPSMAFPDVVDLGVVDVPPAGHDAGQKPPFGLDGPIFVGMDRPDWGSRRGKVKAAYQHALTGYMDHAFPNDELAPLTGSYTNKSVVVAFLAWFVLTFCRFNGWGVSLIDSLDTMWIMGLHDEFDQAMEHVSKMNFTQVSISCPVTSAFS